MKKLGKVAKRTVACSLSAVMVLGLAACGSNGGNNAEPTSEADTASEAEATSDVSVTTESEVISDTSSDELEGAVGKKVDEYSGYLGYGYDVANGGYFNEEDVDATAEVLDMDSLAASGYVRVADMNKTDINSFEGESYSELYGYLADYSDLYSESGLSKDVAFAGISNTYLDDIEKFNYEDYFFKFYNAEVKTQRDVINAKTSVLKDYLAEGFAEDLEKLSADEILDKYGSYVMTDIQNGGKYVLLWTWAESEDYSAEDVYASMDAYLGDYWDFESPYIEGNDIEALETMVDEYNNQQMSNITAEGGSVTIDGTDPFKALDGYASWADSVNNGSTAFIDCTSGIWIWDIIEQVDSDLAKEVKDAYNEQLEEAFEDVETD